MEKTKGIKRDEKKDTPSLSQPKPTENNIDNLIMLQKLVWLVEFLDLNISETEEELKKSKDLYHIAFIQGRQNAFLMIKKHWLKVKS